MQTIATGEDPSAICCHPSVNSFLLMACMGFPCPTNITGILGLIDAEWLLRFMDSPKRMPFLYRKIQTKPTLSSAD
jgi:hypothetical protein